MQFVLGGTNYEELMRWRDMILRKARQNPGLTRVDSDLKETQPQLLVRIDQDRAAAIGVSVETIGQTLQTMMSEKVVTTYVVDGEEYDVILQAKDDQRATPDDLTNIYVRPTRSGQFVPELVPLSNLIVTEDTAGSSSLNRYNRLRAITISATPRPVTPSAMRLLSSKMSCAVNCRRRRASTIRVSHWNIRSLRERHTLRSALHLLVVFLVLAAQFESFVHPLIIMVTVPLALAGGLLGLALAGKTLNIYSQIGVIMLVGIAAKNGVLIVDFINQLRDRGVEFKRPLSMVRGSGFARLS